MGWRPGRRATLSDRQALLGGKVPKDELRGLASIEREPALVTDRGAVAGAEREAVQRQVTAGDVDPAAAAGGQLVLDGLAAVEQTGEEAHVLADGERAAGAVGRD